MSSSSDVPAAARARRELFRAVAPLIVLVEKLEEIPGCIEVRGGQGHLTADGRRYAHAAVEEAIDLGAIARSLGSESRGEVSTLARHVANRTPVIVAALHSMAEGSCPIPEGPVIWGILAQLRPLAAEATAGRAALRDGTGASASSGSDGVDDPRGGTTRG